MIIVTEIPSTDQIEFQHFSDFEVLENEEMWSIRVIDEQSRKESRPVIVTQLSLQDDSTEH